MTALAPDVLARGDAFVDRWLGACFTWNGRTRSGGVDCYGLALAFAREVLGLELPDWRRGDHCRSFVAALMTREAAHYPEHREPADGRLVVARAADEGARHLGVCWRGRVLHADERRGVVLERLAEFAAQHPRRSYLELVP